MHSEKYHIEKAINQFSKFLEQFGNRTKKLSSSSWPLIYQSILPNAYAIKVSLSLQIER